MTVKSFLSTNAIFSTNSIDGIDYCSSNDSTPCNVQQITVPVLFNAMGAYYFIRDNEIHYDLVKSQDKEFIVIAGLVHGITPCNECPGGPTTIHRKISTIMWQVGSINPEGFNSYSDGPETARSTQKFLSRVLFGCIGGKDALQKFVTIDFDVAHRVVRHPGVEFRFGSRLHLDHHSAESRCRGGGWHRQSNKSAAPECVFRYLAHT